MQRNQPILKHHLFRNFVTISNSMCAKFLSENNFLLYGSIELGFRQPGSTLHGYLSKILASSCQDLGNILANILRRYCQELQVVMVRSYQESHVPKKNFIAKSYLARKKSERKSTKIQIFAE